jgi:hypothetical protein
MKALMVNKLLPKTDEQRIEENALAAQAQILFGRPMAQPHAENAFHRTRLLARCRKLCIKNVEAWDEDGLRKAGDHALATYKQSIIGRKMIGELATGDLATQEFFVDESRGFAYGIFNLPGARYIMAVDSERKEFVLHPFREDMSGLEQVEIAGRLLSRAGFRSVDWSAFSAYAQGIGTALGDRMFDLDKDFG